MFVFPLSCCTLPVGNGGGVDVAESRKALLRNLWTERIHGAKQNRNLWTERIHGAKQNVEVVPLPFSLSLSFSLSYFFVWMDLWYGLVDFFSNRFVDLFFPVFPSCFYKVLENVRSAFSKSRVFEIVNNSSFASQLSVFFFPTKWSTFW